MDQQQTKKDEKRASKYAEKVKARKKLANELGAAGYRIDSYGRKNPLPKIMLEGIRSKGGEDVIDQSEECS